MKKTIGRSFSSVFITFAVASILLSTAFPASTSAAVRTAQLIPPGGNECVQIPVHNFTPYIYDGALHSFEFTVPDGAYVGISGAVGETAIPYNQITRRIEPSGALRVHVDTPTTPVRGILNIGITMLSSEGPGEPVCVSIFSTGLAIDGTMHAPAPASKPAPSPAPAPVVVTPKPVSPTPEPQAPTPAPQAKPTSTQAAPTATSVSPFISVQKALKDVCGNDSNALRLWVVLLIVYALIVLAAIFGQSKLPAALQTQEWVATAIVVPFLLLFALWYFAEACRSSAWIPVVATVIALAGLSAAFWERKGPTVVATSTNVINLPGAKK